MFKILKKKIEQGVSQTPLRAAVSAFTRSEDQNTPDRPGEPIAQSTPRKKSEGAEGGESYAESNGSSEGAIPSSRSKNVSSASANVSDVAVGQLVDIPLGGNESLYETASDAGGDGTPVQRSRASSVSSVTSEASSFFPNISFAPNYLPSDAESEMDESGTDLSAISKEDLYTYIKKFERRALKYKSKFMELVMHYKEMVAEREKLRTTLSQSQDRAFRRMSELREQIQLDQLAKKDLEDNYRLMLEERDEFNKVLQMQVKLLKDGKDIPLELSERIKTSKAKAEVAPPEPSATLPAATGSAVSQQIELLKAKVKRQEDLLQKCKETIHNYKEKTLQLATEKQELLAKLEAKGDAGPASGAGQPDVGKLQSQIKEARMVIQQLEADREMAIAQVKQQVHEELEVKDTQLSLARVRTETLQLENTQLQERIDSMQEEIESLKKTSKY